MNLLDENVREDQRSLLNAWRLPVQQIGCDVGRKGMTDEEMPQSADTSVGEQGIGTSKNLSGQV